MQLLWEVQTMHLQPIKKEKYERDKKYKLLQF